MEKKVFAKKLGIKVPVGLEDNKIGMLIDEAIDDLNTWLEAKKNVKKDMKEMGVASEKIGQKKEKIYCGKDPISGERVYK